jgi:putative membrane-bound dehydrogenase-like protein
MRAEIGHILSAKCLRFVAVAFLTVLPGMLSAQDPEKEWQVGASKADITPDMPVRLSGYGSRTQPTSDIDDRLFARAMCFKHGQQKPLILVSLDAIGLSASLTDRIHAKLKELYSLERKQVVLCTSHSHTGPQLDDVLPNLYSTPLTEVERTSMSTISRKTVDAVVKVVGESIERAKPATVSFGTGRAEFAINRRLLKNNVWSGFGTVDDGPVDRSVRCIHAKRPNGSTIAVAYQYACHCTSISPELNKVSADWAGLSAGLLEDAFHSNNSPDAVALPIIGCGADANPNPRGKYEHAQQHASEMAKAVQAVCSGPTEPLPPPTFQAFQLIAIAPERPSKDKLDELAKSQSFVERNFAKIMLDILKLKNRLAETYPAPVHYWSFGDKLAWVFMGGEVVVDYQIRLEKELSQFPNVWVAAYTDDVFAYVASERVRNEGGYEVDSSMLYYAQPGRWVSGTEDLIVSRILKMANSQRLLDQPLSPEASLNTIQMPKGWKVELVAAEPLVEDPVNVAFGADGTVWVVEMGDYPSGGAKSGRIKRMTDTDGDGKLESSTIFLDKLSFPAGVYPWRDGIVVACAPDVFFARDTDHDGVADDRRVLLSGFPLANPQHRVNGFTYGLDHRLHMGTGSEVKEVLEVKTGRKLQVSGCDLSIDVDNGIAYLETGTTQYIRGCDDWGNWFGNDNSHPLYHYVYDREWLTAAGMPVRSLSQHLMQPPSAPPVFPISRDADRFNDLFAANRFTSACSSIFSRSPGATDGMFGCAMVCEPVHNLVSRIQVSPKGVSYAGSRFDEDKQGEWLRSDDPWFRPVRIENGVDGTLWIADMYRRVIEHPEWIPVDWQQRIDVRSGENLGRIYRAYRSDFTPYASYDWSKADDDRLLAALQSPSSTVADIARQQLIWSKKGRGIQSTAIPDKLRRMISQSDQAIGRLRALATLNALGQCKPDDWFAACKDSDSRVVRWAIETMAKQHLGGREERLAVIAAARSELAQQSPALALQLMVSLSYGSEPAFIEVGKLLAHHAGDPWIDGAIAFLPKEGTDTFVEQLLASPSVRNRPMLDQLIPRSSLELKQRLRQQIVSPSASRPGWHYALARQFSQQKDDAVRFDDAGFRQLENDALKAIQDNQEEEATRRSALDLILSKAGGPVAKTVDRLVELLIAEQDKDFANALAKGLLSLGKPAMEKMLGRWDKLPPPSRTSILAEGMLREESALMLLEKSASGTIEPNAFQTAQIEQLRGSKNAEVRMYVEKLFGPPPGFDRLAIVSDYIRRWPSAAATNAIQGEALYKKHCAQCHQDRTDANGVVPSVGPNLQALSVWQNDAWLSAILDPNKAVEPKYRRMSILTTEGSTLIGLKVRETEERIEIVNDQGALVSLSRNSIEEMRESEKSLMPEGFEKVLTPEDVASLVTYIRKLR